MNFLKVILKIVFILFIVNNSLVAQNELDVIRNSWIRYSDSPNSLYRFLSAEANKMLESRTGEIARIETKDEFFRRQSDVKQRIWSLIGPFPGKTPLNARITGTVKKNGYKVENLIYESLPGFYVTASLFIPDKISKPAPAILFLCGHSAGVYRLPLYQLPLLNLVKKGFVVLAIDPLGQGERLQYFDPVKGESIIGSSTKEHSYAAVQVFLTGNSIARYFVWDGIRGVDYLVSRKEVDPKRIGVHGLSGGGTQTAFVSALDDRVAASAPANYITSYSRLLESIGVQDGEQNFYHGISNGIDHADLIEVRAPKPTLIQATTRDFFSIQGSRETFAELKRQYTLLGKPDNIEMTEDDDIHTYTKKNREALYAFFQKHLQQPGLSTEEVVDFASAQELQKTTTGQLATSLGGETVFSLNRLEAEKSLNKLKASRDNSPGHLSSVLKSAGELSGYKEPASVQEPVFTGRIQREGYVVEKYFIKGEGDYVIPYLLMVPSLSNNKAIIYVHPSGKSVEAAPGGEMEFFVKNGFTVMAPDMIGVGETGPGIFTGDANLDGISYNIWFTSTLIGRSLVGIRAGDIVRLSMLLKKNKNISEVYGFARREMAPVMLHAAAFDPSITRIALIEPYSSYQSIVMNRFYDSRFVYSIVSGSLTAYDLPDLAATLAPRKLLMAGVTDGNGKSLNQETISKEMDVIQTTYRTRNADGQLTIVSLNPTEKLNEYLLEWIKNAE